MRRLPLSFFLAALLVSNAAFASKENSADAPALAAMTAQALRYENGEGVKLDQAKAASLYCEAARLGSADAAFHLGWMYANARGLERDDGYAAALFERAAAQGQVYAARMLPFMALQNRRLPPCMTPPALAQVDDPPLPAAWLSNPERAKIVALVRHLAPQFDIDPRFALAVIATESAFEPGAISPRNAQGLMQLIPETAERFNVKKVLDPAQNIRGGLAYLRWLLAYFQGDVRLVAAAYNSGEHTVDHYRGVPPFSETRAYVSRVSALYGKPSHPFDATVTDPSPFFSASKVEAVQEGWPAFVKFTPEQH